MAFDFENDEICDLVGHIVGIGQGSFTRTDNNLTGVAVPGMNAFGFMRELPSWNSRMAATPTLHAVVRWLYDGEEVTTIVHKVELKPTGQ